MPQVISLHRGKREPLSAKPGTFSAIRKTALVGAVTLGPQGIDGDEQVHLKFHGGPFKALCFYASEYYPGWNAHTAEAMPPGSFGENVHSAGLLDAEVCLGDRYRIGEALVEVTAPRGPCNNLAAHWGVKDLHIWCKQQRRTGFYTRTVEPGIAELGSSITLEARPLPGCTMVAFWDVIDNLNRDRATIAAMLACPALDPEWVDKLRRKLEAAEG